MRGKAVTGPKDAVLAEQLARQLRTKMAVLEMLPRGTAQRRRLADEYADLYNQWQVAKFGREKFHNDGKGLR